MNSNIICAIIIAFLYCAACSTLIKHVTKDIICPEKRKNKVILYTNALVIFTIVLAKIFNGSARFGLIFALAFFLYDVIHFYLASFITNSMVLCGLTTVVLMISIVLIQKIIECEFDFVTGIFKNNNIASSNDNYDIDIENQNYHKKFLDSLINRYNPELSITVSPTEILNNQLNDKVPTFSEYIQEILNRRQ